MHPDILRRLETMERLIERLSTTNQGTQGSQTSSEKSSRWLFLCFMVRGRVEKVQITVHPKVLESSMGFSIDGIAKRN